jgi:hypothetical protein
MWWKDLKGKYTLEDKQILEFNITMGLSRCSVRMWNGFKWLKIGTSDGLL